MRSNAGAQDSGRGLQGVGGFIAAKQTAEVRQSATPARFAGMSRSFSSSACNSGPPRGHARQLGVRDNRTRQSHRRRRSTSARIVVPAVAGLHAGGDGVHSLYDCSGAIVRTRVLQAP